MKIERFVLGGFVAATIFVVCGILIGDSIMQQKYDVDDVPQFTAVEDYQDDFDVVEDSMEQELMTAGNPGQSNDDAPEEERFWKYQGRALAAVWDTVIAPNNARGGITELGNYLKVNATIIGAILTFVIISFGFAVAAFWYKRRA